MAAPGGAAGGAAARHARVKQLFLEVRERPAAERGAALAAACLGDEALRAEVESLLSFDHEEELLAAPPSSVADTAPIAPRPEAEGRAATAGDPLGLVGTTLDGRYRVDALASEGGFAYVYRAEQVLWRRPVAVKVFKLERGDATLRDAFIKEGALLNQLSRRTTAIVQSYDVGTWIDAGGRPRVFTVLEWLDGSTLAQQLSRERKAGPAPWSLGRVLVEMGPVADALAVAHAAGVAHRDVKPPNIFLASYDGDPASSAPVPLGASATKLLDFGVAKVAAEHADGFHATGGSLAAFTLAWAAPEQLSKRLGATGPWTDVYALALVCAELLSGRRRDDADDPVRDTVRFRDASAAPSPRRQGAEVSDAVEAVFTRALNIEPAARFPDAAAFWGALTTAVSRGADVAATATGRERRRAAAFVAAVTVALVSGAVWLALRGG